MLVGTGCSGRLSLRDPPGAGAGCGQDRCVAPSGLRGQGRVEATGHTWQDPGCPAGPTAPESSGQPAARGEVALSVVTTATSCAPGCCCSSVGRSSGPPTSGCCGNASADVRPRPGRSWTRMASADWGRRPVGARSDGPGQDYLDGDPQERPGQRHYCRATESS
jgi:hypothetical protein